MMRGVNVVEAVLMALGVLASLAFLPDALSAYGREPEDFWLLSFWLVTCIAFCGLCVWNVISADGRVVHIANWTALALMSPVALAGLADILLLLICVVTMMGPAMKLLHLRVRKRAA